MRNKRVISIIAIILVLLMAFSLVAGALSTAFADSDSELEQLKKDRDELVKEMYAQQAKVEELESQHADVVSQKLAMDERNEACRREIAVLEREIELYEAMIEQKGIEVENARIIEEEQLERYRVRVRAMEESGGYNLLAVIFNAGDLSGKLSAVDDMREIMEQDRQLEEEYIASRENSEKVREEYQLYKQGLEESRTSLENDKLLLEQQIAEADELIVRILEDIDSESELYEQIRSSERAVETQIANMIIALERKRAAEEEARQQAAQQAAQSQAANSSGENGASSDNGQTGTTPAVVGTGNFSWPCSCRYITSVVGNRYHPISGEYKYHAGMDIGCSYGDTIWASDSGTVITAGVNGGYGNCVIIDHANGYYTLYGHMSSIAVSVGQTVNQGQTVGYVGSTGVSTGPHLHFEIRNSGGAIDFNGWFGGLTYAPDAGDPNS